jgi:acetylornithine deacetylase
MADVVALLSDLIACRSDLPAGDEGALARRLHGELEQRGADELELVEVPRPGAAGAYVLARFGTPWRLVNVHLDTVPPNRGWSRDPFSAHVDGGRLYGLGAADTKGAIAAVLCALDAVRPRDTAILFSGDEEQQTRCMRRFLDGGRAAGITHAVVCEPTGLRLGTRHRGILMLTAKARGEGGHSSRADALPAPVAALARVAVAWDDWGRAQRSVGPSGFPGMCLNLAKLDGGVAFNVVPSEATLEVSLRPPPGVALGPLVDELSALARAVAPEVELAAPIAHPSFQTRDVAPFLACLGERGAPIDLAFWTEAALLSAAGIDAVVCGPGDIAQAHAPDEWVALDQLKAAEAAFTRLFA